MADHSNPHEPVQPGLQPEAEHPAGGSPYKRPTPSISTLLASVPPLHGKLPPLRSSTDGAAGGSLPPLGQAHPQLPALHPVKQSARFDCPEQQQEQQQHAAVPQTGPQQMQQPANEPQHHQQEQEQEQEQQLQDPEQLQPPKQSWVGAFQHPREFFLRFSQLRHSSVADVEESPPPSAAVSEAEAAAAAAAAAGIESPQEQQLHWWQGRPSGMTQRNSTAAAGQASTPPPAPSAAPPVASDQPNSSSSSSSWAARRLQLLRLLDSPLVNWVLVAMSLFVIFQEDVKYALLPPPADLWFESITLALLITFMIEIGLSCLVRPGFFLSFYFWLDTVAVLSLAFELPALRAALLLGETQDYVNLNNEDSYLMAAGAQALVSSKAGRAAKMVRLFRQLQLIKLFKQLELWQRLKRVLAEGRGVGPDSGLTAAQAQVLSKYKHSESRVGQRLSDLTMKRVISGILAMLIVLPALEITSGINGSTASLPLGGLQMLHMQALTGGANTSAFNASLQAFKHNIEYQLAGQPTGGILQLVLANVSYVEHPAYSSIGATLSPAGSASKQTAKEWRRYLELQAASFQSYLCPADSPLAASTLTSAPQAAVDPAAAWSRPGIYLVLDAPTATAAAAAAAAAAGSDVDGGAVLRGWGCERSQSFLLLDIKWSLQAQSVYGIARTLFLVCLLGLGSYLIHSDTYRLVLQPVQRMVDRVREMAEDPLMLAAVRQTPGLMGAGASGDGSSARTSTGPEKTDPPLKPPTNTSSSGGGSSSDGSKAPRAIRFWPSVRVHAVADGSSQPGSPSVGTAAAAAAVSGLKDRPSVLQQQLFPGGTQEQPLQLTTAGSGSALVAPMARRARASSAALVMQRAKRLSAHLSAGVSAGVSAAGRAAYRLRNALVTRASAIQQLLVVDEAEQETSQGQYETRLLEQSIYKICALLAVGFGDAGAEVIAENIKKEGDLNPCMPGKKMVAVFGFCDIRRFTDTTEVLQEGVMEFVNVIAHLVHTAVAARGGAANKNIGDAFLLVWKLPKGLDDRDVSVLSSGGAPHSPGSPLSHLGPPSPTRAMRTATLNWPSLAEEQEGEGGQGDVSSSSSSPRHQHHASLPGAVTPTGLSRPGSQAQLSAATDAEISAMLQQQHKQLTIKRAASGITDTGPQLSAGGSHRGRHSGGPSSIAAGGGGLLVSSGDGSHQVEGSGLSSSGLRRAMLSIKSVAGATPLSAAAKASIIHTIADSALASFVVIQVAVSVSRVLKAYSNRPDLNARMPGFSVQMGFGLHVGWAIEGAIGSEYKIDASYLSPNVNLASRLEAATKQYSVSMLLSRDFVDCLSPAVRAKVRQIDCVTVKGSNQPLGLFCYDLDLAAASSQLAALAAAHGSSSSSSGARMSSRVSTARGLQAVAAAGGGAGDAGQQEGVSTAGGLPAVGRIRHSLAVLPDDASAARSSVVVPAGHNSWRDEEQSGPDPAEVLLSLDYDDDWADNPVVCRSWALSWDFKEAFDEAFDDYLAGRWPQAREAFEELLHARTCPAAGGGGGPAAVVEDPPTRTLLSFMAGHGYVAPEGWAGVRELTEK